MIKGVFRKRLRERPFDLYTAVLIFLAGSYAIFSDDWPEKTHAPNAQALILFISIYLMVASAFVISALICNREQRPVFAIMAEMWGWCAISAASFSITIMYLSQLLYVGSQSLGVSVIMIAVWVGMCLASGLRSMDIYLVLRGRR